MLEKMLEKFKRVRWIEVIGAAAGILGVVSSFVDPYIGFALACSAIALGMLAYRRQKVRDEPAAYVVVALGLGSMAMVIAMALMIMGVGTV